MSAEKDTPGGEMLVYEAADGSARVDVRLERDTVWLTQKQMSELFETSTDNVGLHLKNIFADNELEEPATTEDFSVVRSEGGRQIRRHLKHYNLDAIISVGYRVNSRRGVRFRQWATGVLSEHLVRGYTFNQTRLAERGLREARQTLDLLTRTLQNQTLVNDTGRAVLELISGYADTWRLLLEYDENRLPMPPGARPSKGVLDFAKASAAIAEFKRELVARKEAAAIFGNPRSEALEGILGNIEQTMFGEALYRSREEKAVNLLYLVIKDHPFSDGNKRIGSFLFMLYLQQEGIAHSLNPMALTALALLIAESAPTTSQFPVGPHKSTLRVSWELPRPIKSWIPPTRNTGLLRLARRPRNDERGCLQRAVAFCRPASRDCLGVGRARLLRLASACIQVRNLSALRPWRMTCIVAAVPVYALLGNSRFRRAGAYTTRHGRTTRELCLCRPHIRVTFRTHWRAL